MYGWYPEMSLEPKKGPVKWDTIDPDQERSPSYIYDGEHNGSIYWIIEVKDLGCIVMRASQREDGPLTFHGVSEFTTVQIERGYIDETSKAK